MVDILVVVNDFWRPTLEILILWFIFYRIVLFFEGTRALQVLRGVVILIFAFIIAQWLRLATLDWILTRLFAISIIGLIIIFQAEIRQGLARLGQRHFFGTSLREEEQIEILKEVIQAVQQLSFRRHGAIIAIEHLDSLKDYIESGVITDSKISKELIQTIFTPNSLLHDGGVVIQQAKMIAAGCLFPLTEKSGLSRTLGTRHRAAIGLTENRDCLALLVSEETGKVSLAKAGWLLPVEDFDLLIKDMKEYLSKK